LTNKFTDFIQIVWYTLVVQSNFVSPCFNCPNSVCLNEFFFKVSY